MSKSFTQTVREYTIKDKLGVGAYGTIYRVYKQDQRKIYVLKQISLFNMGKKEIEDVRNEAKLLSSLSNEFIVKYYASFIENNTLNIVMEYCESGDLSKYLNIKRNLVKTLHEDLVWKFFIQISLGIVYLHAKKVLHRDLKSMNIFLTKNNDARIGDLGVAKVLSGTQFAKTYIGTPYYLSPEICEEHPYNEKSDIWALGCILYELTTFKHPFTANNQAALIMKIVKGKFEPISREYSNDLKFFVNYLLEKDFNKRPTIFDIIVHPITIKKAKSLNMLELIVNDENIQALKTAEIKEIIATSELKNTEDKTTGVLTQLQPNLLNLKRLHSHSDNKITNVLVNNFTDFAKSDKPIDKQDGRGVALSKEKVEKKDLERREKSSERKIKIEKIEKVILRPEKEVKDKIDSSKEIVNLNSPIIGLAAIKEEKNDNYINSERCLVTNTQMQSQAQVTNIPPQSANLIKKPSKNNGKRVVRIPIQITKEKLLNLEKSEEKKQKATVTVQVDNLQKKIITSCIPKKIAVDKKIKDNKIISQLVKESVGHALEKKKVFRSDKNIYIKLPVNRASSKELKELNLQIESQEKQLIDNVISLKKNLEFQHKPFSTKLPDEIPSAVKSSGDEVSNSNKPEIITNLFSYKSDVDDKQNYVTNNLNKNQILENIKQSRHLYESSNIKSTNITTSASSENLLCNKITATSGIKKLKFNLKKASNRATSHGIPIILKGLKKRGESCDERETNQERESSNNIKHIELVLSDELEKIKKIKKADKLTVTKMNKFSPEVKDIKTEISSFMSNNSFALDKVEANSRPNSPKTKLQKPIQEKKSKDSKRINHSVGRGDKENLEFKPELNNERKKSIPMCHKEKNLNFKNFQQEKITINLYENMIVKTEEGNEKLKCKSGLNKLYSLYTEQSNYLETMGNQGNEDFDNDEGDYENENENEENEYEDEKIKVIFNKRSSEEESNREEYILNTYKSMAQKYSDKINKSKKEVIKEIGEDDFNKIYRLYEKIVSKPHEDSNLTDSLFFYIRNNCSKTVNKRKVEEQFLDIIRNEINLQNVQSNMYKSNICI